MLLVMNGCLKDLVRKAVDGETSCEVPYAFSPGARCRGVPKGGYWVKP